MAPPSGAEHNFATATSELNCETSSGEGRKGSDGVTFTSAVAEDHAAPTKSISLPTALAEDVPTEPMKAELLPRAEAVSGVTQADAPKTETTSHKPVARNGCRGGQSPKKQKISAAGSKAKRKLLMRQVLQYLRIHPNLSAAARKCGIHSKTLAYWLKRSKAGDPAYELEWRGLKLPFHEHCEAAKAEPFDKVLAIAIEWTDERIVYKIDPDRVALGFEGRDAYLRDEKGMPVVEAVHHAKPKMIRFVLEYGCPEKWGKASASQEPGVEASIKTRRWQAIKNILDKED